MGNPKIQEWTLERVLSFPLCSESIIQTLMCEKYAVELVIKIARDVVKEGSKDKLNLLHKCFWFQFESGHILINKETVINYNFGKNGTIIKLITESKREIIIILLLVIIAAINIPNTTPQTIPPI